MKKYVKPDLYYESFALSHSVASGCDPDFIVTHTVHDCTLDFGGDLIFSSGNSDCLLVLEDFCLQTGGQDSAFNAFSS